MSVSLYRFTVIHCSFWRIENVNKNKRHHKKEIKNHTNKTLNNRLTLANNGWVL